MLRNTKVRHEELEVFFQIIFFCRVFEKRFIRASISISKIILVIYLLGELLVAASKSTWIQEYVSDTQKRHFSFSFQKIINMSKQRTLPNIYLEYPWQISFWLKILFRN